ncbi:MAG: serine hydrolase [Candidatus Eremiobacteraeota bacterium]|nr:serine hydrolase [Candidatus Eremiobacteraeota bacterium]MBC5827582.1 serine hydrolase [Candidatus Eremiobacteraeota bacterium]
MVVIRLLASRLIAFAAVALIFAPAEVSARTDPTITGSFSSPTALASLQRRLMRLANAVPGAIALSVVDLRRGTTFNINGDDDLPAASTIKIPVMVEVLRQVTVGKFSLGRTVSLQNRDRDWGYGSLCDAPSGRPYSVRDLLWLMITRSDNTATNMLIRLVGRHRINQTMIDLGLDQTRLGDIIHSDGDVRELRTSANDMMHLLSMIAQRRVINAGACDFMLEMMLAQRHNTLLPVGLPKDVPIAHKTGTLHDTLNDVGVVELDGSPYIICVLTTHLRDLDFGERFIRQASRLTFRSFLGLLSAEGVDGDGSQRQ